MPRDGESGNRSTLPNNSETKTETVRAGLDDLVNAFSFGSIPREVSHNYHPRLQLGYYCTDCSLANHRSSLTQGLKK